MMKKRILSVILVISLILPLCVTVHAEDAAYDYLLSQFDYNGNGNLDDNEITFENGWVSLNLINLDYDIQIDLNRILFYLRMTNCDVHINGGIIDDNVMYNLIEDTSNHYYFYNIEWHVTNNPELLNHASEKKALSGHSLSSISELDIMHTPWYYYYDENGNYCPSDDYGLAVLSFFAIPNRLSIRSSRFSETPTEGIDFTELVNSLNADGSYSNDNDTFYYQNHLCVEDSTGADIKSIISCEKNAVYGVCPSYLPYVQSSVTKLYISSCYDYVNGKNDGFSDDTSFERFENLNFLQIYAPFLPYMDFSSLTNLESFHFYNSGSNGPINISLPPNVTNLNIRSSTLSDAFNFPTMPNLKTLILYCSTFNGLTSDELPDTLKSKMPALQDLEIERCIFKDTVSEKYMPGDKMLEYIANNIPTLTRLAMPACNITDISCVTNFSDCIFNFRSNLIAYAKGNNRQVIENLRAADKIERNSYNNEESGLGYQGNFYRNSNKTATIPNTDISVESSQSKTTYLPGDLITQTVAITNNGSETQTVDVAFGVRDNYDVTIENGQELQQAVVSPGQTIHRSITIKPGESCTSNLESGSFAAVSVGKNAAMVGFYVERGKSITLHTDTFLENYANLSLWGTCSGDATKVEIQLADGTTLGEATITSPGFFRADNIEVPENLWPQTKGTSSTISVKAVATSEDKTTFSSDTRTITLFLSPDESEMQIVDYKCAAYGTGRWFTGDSFSVLYQGDRILSRVLLEGVEDSDIDYVITKINDKSYDMSKVEEGIYKDYYYVKTDAIEDEDYVTAYLEIKKKDGPIIQKQILMARVIIDPSGIISDPEGNPIEGVEVTIFKKNDDTGEWDKWDAENYLQQNPLLTNAEGYYGWDVPQGTYKLEATKDGYENKTVETYYSRDEGTQTAITIPPPRLDVDFTMNYADPENPPVALQKDDTARAAVEAKLDEMTSLPASTDEKAITDELNSSLTENMYVSFKTGTYNKTEDNITGTLVLENLYTGETQDIDLSVSLMSTLDKLPTPNITIDYVNEKLVGFEEDGTYEINFEPVTPVDGKVPASDYMGISTTTIVRMGDGITTDNSDPQLIFVIGRPLPPVADTDFTVTQPTTPTGKGTIAAVTADTLEYYDNNEWKSLSTEGVEFDIGTTVKVRKAASSSKGSFASMGTDVSIVAPPPEKYPMPAVTIDYATEQLTGFETGGTYTINNTPVTPSEGKLSIADYIKGSIDTISIVRKSDSMYTADSDAQSLIVPPRPAAPVQDTDFTVTNPTTHTGKGKITATEAATAALECYDDSQWKAVTTEGVAVNSGTIKVRKAAVTTEGSEAFPSASVDASIVAPDAQKLPTPSIAIDYANEQLTGFETGGIYTIKGVSVTPIDGKLPIMPYIGDDSVTIIHKGDNGDTLDSDTQTLSVPARPAAPVLDTDFTVIQPTAAGGKGKVAANAEGALEYYADGEWKALSTEGVEVDATVQVRKVAVTTEGSEAFPSASAEATIIAPEPSAAPTAEATAEPPIEPTTEPTAAPSAEPITEPTTAPSDTPTTEPTTVPTAEPVTEPTTEPTTTPNVEPTAAPTVEPVTEPTTAPTAEPVTEPTTAPTAEPTTTPNVEPTAAPSDTPITEPTAEPTTAPTTSPDIIYPISIISSSAWAYQSDTGNNDTAHVKATFANTSEEDISFKAYYALYKDDVLIGIYSKDISLESGKQAVIDADVPRKGEIHTRVKVFAWDNKLKPMVKQATKITVVTSAP